VFDAQPSQNSTRPFYTRMKLSPGRRSRKRFHSHNTLIFRYCRTSGVSLLPTKLSHHLVRYKLFGSSHGGLRARRHNTQYWYNTEWASKYTKCDNRRPLFACIPLLTSLTSSSCALLENYIDHKIVTMSITAVSNRKPKSPKMNPQHTKCRYHKDPLRNEMRLAQAIEKQTA
jgi:hypothetical protein